MTGLWPRACWRMSWRLIGSGLENCNHLIWKWDAFFILTLVMFIQLLGDSPLLYVSISWILHCDSFWFVLNDSEVIIFPNKKTGITWFKIGITSSSELQWDLFKFQVILHYFIDPNQASYIVIHLGLFRMTKKLSYSQTWKLKSPDLKVG